MAVWCIAAAADLVSTGDLFLVIGTAEGGGHAWIELIEDGEPLWADPTPGWPKDLAQRGAWPTHVPEWAYRWTGQDFGDRVRYERTNG